MTGTGTSAFAREQLAAARLWAVTQQPYLAAALFAVSFVEAPGHGTLGVDKHWRLYYDRAALDRWTTEETGVVLVHEAMHLLRAHHERAQAVGVTETESHRWNVAADFEVNDDLAHMPLPVGALHPGQVGMPTGDLAEVYFRALEGWGLPGTWCHGGSGTDALWREWELGENHHGVGTGEGDLIRHQVAIDIGRALNAGGHVPDALRRWAGAFLHPRVDWRRRLAGSVRTVLGVTVGAVDYHYSRPSRRNGSPIAKGVVLPSMVAPSPRVAVVVDTSGSMSAERLERAMTELRGILRTAGVSGRSVRVLSCDTAVRSAQEVFGPGTVRLEGGGGTSLGAGLQEAARARPPVDVCIVLTDGYSRWPQVNPGRARTVIGVIGPCPWPSPPWAEVCGIDP